MKKITYNRNLIVFIFLVGAFVTILNQTVLFTALPQIINDFQISASTAQWLNTSYMMTNGILIPVTAFFIGKYTTRSLMITAMIFFITGTLLAAVSHNFILLLIARIIQACGAGITMPLMQTVFFAIFPKEKRGAAMGLVGLVIAFAPAIGPTLSGLILAQWSWRYIFLMVLPIATIVLLLTIVYLKNVSEVNKQQKLDLRSVTFSTVGFGALLYGISIAGSASMLNILLWIISGLIGLSLLIHRALKLDKPMLEFRVFKSPSFVFSTIAVVISFICLMGPQTLLPLYIQNVRGMSPLSSGLLLLPGAIANGIVSMIAGRIYDKVGGKYLGVVGFLLITCAVVPFVTVQFNTSLWVIILFYALMMVGISMIMMPMTTAGLNSLSDGLIKHGTAMINTFRQVGGSIGTALLISIYTKISNQAVGLGEMESVGEAQVHGMRYAFIGIVVFACIGLIVSALLNNKKQTSVITESSE
ncbi:MDR family MFS transporter [Paenibacillus massiliensis]|uniref:MDR family MFS transporter n=1 Tax=Paenibacillus massiliensis TaxID=225917 RepID=UPI00037D0E23|nr:MDR family MFS transporter [Paenibacillus massiliensis]